MWERAKDAAFEREVSTGVAQCVTARDVREALANTGRSVSPEMLQGHDAFRASRATSPPAGREATTGERGEGT